jgi:hypothetical protein
LEIVGAWRNAAAAPCRSVDCTHTTIALAFGSRDYEARVLGDVIERAATAAASLAVALLQRKLPVGLVANGHDPQSGADGVALRPPKATSSATNCCT